MGWNLLLNSLNAPTIHSIYIYVQIETLDKTFHTIRTYEFLNMSLNTIEIIYEHAMILISKIE